MAFSDIFYALFCILLANATNFTDNPFTPDWTIEFHEVPTSSQKCVTDEETVVASTLNQWPRSTSRTPNKDLFFAILFYDDPFDELRHRVTINAAIDVAVQRVQAPGGLLEGFNITTKYRDSQSSSLYGALAAWDFHYIYQPGW